MDNKKSFIFNKLFRFASKGNLIAKVLYYFYTDYVLGLDIKHTTSIGSGFQIFHGARGSVISPGAKIGNNVSLRQNTTIGSKGFSGEELSPIVEDEVTIGPNVCIIGNIRVGHNSIIGAGSVVVKDVEPYSVVAGNPAKVIKKIKK